MGDRVRPRRRDEIGGAKDTLLAITAHDALQHHVSRFEVRPPSF